MSISELYMREKDGKRNLLHNRMSFARSFYWNRLKSSFSTHTHTHTHIQMNTLAEERKCFALIQTRANTISFQTLEIKRVHFFGHVLCDRRSGGWGLEENERKPNKHPIGERRRRRGFRDGNLFGVVWPLIGLEWLCGFRFQCSQLNFWLLVFFG